jgi:propanol-preferring alcohol dehydrogenase
LLGAQPAEYIFKNMAITGTLVGSMHDTQRALEFAQQVRYPRMEIPRLQLTSINHHQGLLKPVYEKYPIDKLPEAVEKLRRGQAVGRCIVDFNM